MFFFFASAVCKNPAGMRIKDVRVNVEGCRPALVFQPFAVVISLSHVCLFSASCHLQTINERLFLYYTQTVISSRDTRYPFPGPANLHLPSRLENFHDNCDRTPIMLQARDGRGAARCWQPRTKLKVWSFFFRTFSLPSAFLVWKTFFYRKHTWERESRKRRERLVVGWWRVLVLAGMKDVNNKQEHQHIRAATVSPRRITSL